MPNKNSQMDPYVVEYIKDKMIKARYGNDVDVDFLDKEMNRVYLQIEDGIFDLSYNQLSSEQQNELEQMVNTGANVTEIQDYMQKNISNLVDQIRSYMILVTESYLNGEI